MRAALALILALAAAAPAQAATSLKKGIWGPVRVNGVSQFPIYRQLGAGVYNARLSWHDAAPTRPVDPRDPADPAYRWPAELDDAIAQGRRYGQRIAVEVSYSPAWANGGRPRQWAPTRARDYADFLTAAARRFPGVRYWIIWSEATRGARFQPLVPQTSRTKPLTRAQAAVAPRRYAELLDAAYVALKGVSRRNLVIGGSSLSSGDISPLNWIRALKLPNGRRPRMDLYGHNPFGARRPDISRGQIRPGFIDMCDLDDLARYVDRYLRGHNGRRLKLWLGEYFIPTDHANHEFNWWVSRRTQASWLRDALRLVRHDKRVATFNYLGLYDDPPQSDGREVNRGLIDFSGRPKPAFAVFSRG